MSQQRQRMEFSNTKALPTLGMFDEVRYLLVQLGTPKDIVENLPPTVIGFIADHLQQINTYKDRIRKLQENLQNAEFDVIRLRGQRNALRAALIKNSEQDPLLGYVSNHMLEAITTAHRKSEGEDKQRSDEESGPA